MRKCAAHPISALHSVLRNGAVHSKYTEEKSADEPESDRWVSVKPGLWTLDWTVDWTVDWTMD